MTFLVLFTTETFGVYKFVHFCGSEKTSESFYIKKDACCCGDDEDESDDCCTNETAVIQLKEENSIVSFKHVKTPDDIATELFHHPVDKTDRIAGPSFSIVSKSAYQHSLYSKPPLQVRYCVFLI